MHRLSGGQNAQHNILVVTARGGERRHPQFNVLVRESKEDFAILRLAPFRDVQMRQDFEA